MSDPGAEPPRDHEEGTLQEEEAITPGRTGAAISGSDAILALWRIVDKNGPMRARNRQAVGGFEGRPSVYGARGAA